MKNWEKPTNVTLPTTNGGKIYRFLCYTACSGFGVGYFPIASATAGSFATLPFAFAAAYFFGLWGILILAAFSMIIGTIASKEVLKYTEHDPSIIIIDEVVGQLLTFVLVANATIDNINAWPAYIIGFFLFRFYDILKPQPAKWADTKLLNEWGVMLDDVFAGVYAAITLYIVSLFVSIM